MPTTDVLLPAQHLAIYAAEAAYFSAGFAGVRTGREYRTGWGGSLICQEVNYDSSCTVEEVMAGDGVAVAALLTEDGRGAVTTEWHRGPETGDSVYVERYEAGEGRVRLVFHGYVDPTTRRVTQTG